MFAAVRIVGQQQDAGAGGEDEQQADQRLLDLRPAPTAPGQQQRGGAGGGRRRRLGGDVEAAVAAPLGQAGGDDAQRRHLGDGQVDEDDALAQHLAAERHVGRQHQQAGGERHQQQTPVDAVHFRAPLQAGHGIVEQAEQVLGAIVAADGEGQHYQRHVRPRGEPLGRARRVVGGADHHPAAAGRRRRVTSSPR